MKLPAQHLYSERSALVKVIFAVTAKVFLQLHVSGTTKVFRRGVQKEKSKSSF
jgi:hypothetical protein